MILNFEDFKILENENYDVEFVLSMLLSPYKKTHELGVFYNEEYLNNYLYYPNFKELTIANFPFGEVGVGFINHIKKNLSPIKIPLKIFERYFPKDKNLILMYYKRSREVAPLNTEYDFNYEGNPIDIKQYNDLIQYIIDYCFVLEDKIEKFTINVDDFDNFDVNFNKINIHNLTIKSKNIDLSKFNKDCFRNVKHLEIDCNTLILKDVIDLSNLIFNEECIISITYKNSTIQTNSVEYKFSNSKITFENSYALKIKLPERFIVQELKKQYPNITFLKLKNKNL